MPGVRPVVFHDQVPAPYAPCAVHEPPSGCRKNSYWGEVQPVEVAVNVIVVPGDCGCAALGLIDEDVQPVRL